MTVVEAHADRHGYTVTATTRAPNGAKVSYSASGPDFEEVKQRVLEVITRLLPIEEDQGESTQ